MACPVVHFEIGCRDREKTVAFFSKLLGWEINAQGPAAMINTGVKEGIQGHIAALGHPPHNYITVYAQVDDLPKYMKQAEALGGKSLVGPVEVPGMGSFAWIADPEGTPFGLWKPAA